MQVLTLLLLSLSNAVEEEKFASHGLVGLRPSTVCTWEHGLAMDRQFLSVPGWRGDDLL